MTGSLNTLLPDTLDCSVSLSPQQIDEFHLDFLIVQVCSPSDLEAKDSILHLDILDMTEGLSHLHAVYEYQGDGDSLGEVFSRQRPLCATPPGQVPTARTTIAQIDTGQLCFARQGVRRLLFRVTWTSRDGSELAKSQDEIEYDNPNLGYLNWQENRELIRLQAVQLASALVMQSQKSFSPDQHGLLRGWLLNGIDLAKVSPKGKRTFEKSFQRLLKVSCDAGLNQIIALGQEMESKSTVGQRQEIVEFCLHLICLIEPLPTTSLVTLQKIAILWQIDTSQFSIILEKVVSIDRLRDIDPMVLAGMTENMSPNQVLKQLNRAYAKWNGRITHSDKAVQRQAEDMISWIAQARGRTQTS